MIFLPVKGNNYNIGLSKIKHCCHFDIFDISHFFLELAKKINLENAFSYSKFTRFVRQPEGKRTEKKYQLTREELQKRQMPPWSQKWPVECSKMSIFCLSNMIFEKNSWWDKYIFIFIKLFQKSYHFSIFFGLETHLFDYLTTPSVTSSPLPLLLLLTVRKSRLCNESAAFHKVFEKQKGEYRRN